MVYNETDVSDVELLSVNTVTPDRLVHHLTSDINALQLVT